MRRRAAHPHLIENMHYLKVEELSAQQMKTFLTLNKVDDNVVQYLSDVGFNGQMLASYKAEEYAKFTKNQQRVFGQATVFKLLHIRDIFRFGLMFGDKSKFTALIDHEL